MARKRNPETIRSIADASFKLFGEKGYADTSYADIAGATGINRATVQHYFPAKELMASVNLARLRESAVAESEAVAPGGTPSFARLYLLGQIYIAALMSTPESRRFFKDVLDSRSLTEDTISADFSWSMEYVLGAPMGDGGSEEAREDIVVAMGGLYDLMYYCIGRDRSLNVSQRLQPAFRAFSQLRGQSEIDIDEMFARYALPTNELRKLGKAAYDAIPDFKVGEAV